MVNDMPEGNEINNLFNMGDGGENISKGSRSDEIWEQGGNELFDDVIEKDTAYFSGKVGEYNINYNPGSNTFTIEDTVVNRDGTDVFSDVDEFVFSDFSSDVDFWI